MKAFPQKYPQDPSRPWSQLANPVDCGMDLRDYFAAQVLSKLISWYEDGDEESMIANPIVVAETAYEYADAMMKARNDS